MAARAFIETGNGTLRAVCRESGVCGPFVRETSDRWRSEREALAMLSDACDCDDHHSVVEDVMDKVRADGRRAGTAHTEAELDKARAFIVRHEK